MKGRFAQDPDFERQYRAVIEKYMNEGYIVRADEPSYISVPKKFFLPHVGVTKRSASVPKLCIVFDSAATFEGKLLNDATEWLASVLLRFREGLVAFTASVEAMFSRICLRSEDARSATIDSSMRRRARGWRASTRWTPWRWRLLLTVCSCVYPSSGITLRAMRRHDASWTKTPKSTIYSWARRRNRTQSEIQPV